MARTVDFTTNLKGNLVITVSGVVEVLSNAQNVLIQALPDASGVIVRLSDDTYRRPVYLSDTITNGGVSAGTFATPPDLITYLGSNFFLKASGGAGSTAFSALTGAPTDNTALATALAGKANSPLPNVLYAPPFNNNASNGIEYNADLFLQALKYLGSTLKGETIGVMLMHTSGTNFLMATGRWYIAMIKIHDDQTIANINFMLATPASGTNTGNTKNRVGLYTYNQGGTLTQVAASADNVNLYRQTAGVILSEPILTNATPQAAYNALSGFAFIVFLYGSTDVTAPNLMGVSMGFASKMGVLTTNSARIQGVSLTAGKTDLPNTINFSTDVSPTALVGACWGGVS